jgi:phosphate transport system substrate-binding protein
MIKRLLFTGQRSLNIGLVALSLMVVTIPVALTGCSAAPAFTDSASAFSDSTINEAGSTTVQPLAEKLANAYMKIHNDMTVVIQGGGSSVGIRSVADGVVDIGASSRQLNADDPPLVTHLIAIDSLAVIVHQNNPVKDLSLTQIKDIFSGRIRDWAEVGGQPGAIHVAAREEGSGTRTTFDDLVMKKDRLEARAILQSSNGAIHQVVSRDELAIGFLSFNYVSPAVRPLKIDSVPVSFETAQSGAYPLTRPLYFLTREAPTGAVKSFLDFCASPEGRQILIGEGYVPPP